MARNISFSMTTEQFVSRRKDVTRRMGWEFLERGTELKGCEKCQGLRRGETVKVLGRIRVCCARQEPLMQMLVDRKYGQRECIREGFPDLSPDEFVEMFCDGHRGCDPSSIITRIRFVYLQTDGSLFIPSFDFSKVA